MKEGPLGILTVFPGFSMGRNLSLTLLYFFVVSFCIAYLAHLALAPAAEPMKVFQFVAAAGFITFLAGIVQHAIWFRCRIAGHVIESVLYAVVIGGTFSDLWPSGTP